MCNHGSSKHWFGPLPFLLLYGFYLIKKFVRLFFLEVMFKPNFANVNINRIQQLEETAMVAWWIKAETKTLRFRDRDRHQKFLLTYYWQRKATDGSIFICWRNIQGISAVVQWLVSPLMIERFGIRFPGTVIIFFSFCSQFAHSSKTCLRCAVYCYSAGTGRNVVLPTS